jgi:pimeloyl-ACP methyl ester carboxylesterase
VRVANACWFALAASTGLCAADRVVLKDGTSYTGAIELKDDRIEVTERHRVVSISRSLLLQPEEAIDAKPPISFRVPQPVPSKPPRPLNPLVGYARVDPFDEFGRRSVAIIDEGRRTANHVQAIHALFPTHVETDVVEGSFRSTASLSVLPGPILRKILRRCIDPAKEPERLRVVEFLLQADRFEEAEQEIAELKRESFSAAMVDGLTVKLARRLVDRLIVRLDRLAAAGDIARCRTTATEARKGASAEQNAKIDSIIQAVEKQAADIAKAERVLAGAAMAVAAHPRSVDLNAAIRAVQAGLSTATLERLNPMLFLTERSDAKPLDLAALAVSGFCAGEKLAQADVDRAADLWRCREHLLAAMSGGEIAFQDRLRKLQMPPVEGRPRVRPDVLSAMTTLLPGPSTERQPDSTSQVQLKGPNDEVIEYLVHLPPGYNRHRRWPAVIALHDQNGDPQKEMPAWRGSASEFGVIVCCPAWKKDEGTAWGYAVEDHVRLEQVVVDLRRRFSIDSDRVHLAGRGAGGDAAWDFAAGHADEFAGFVSLSGLPTKYAERYTVNFTQLPTLSLHGGLNMQRATMMHKEFTKLSAAKCDAVHIVYPARGGEGFASDMPMIFDWMSRRTRTPFPRKVNAVSARVSDRRFHWMEIEEFKDGAVVPQALLSRNRFTPATLNANVTDAGTIVVRTGNILSLELMLSPKLAPLDAPGFAVKVNSKTVLKGPVEPDIETILRRLRKTGDSSRLVTNIVTVKRP